MFKRIKNLLDISRYTVEELKQTRLYPQPEYPQPQVRPAMEPSSTYTVTEDILFKPATIINMIEVDPFADITNETTQQSPDDTAARN